MGLIVGCLRASLPSTSPEVHPLRSARSDRQTEIRASFVHFLMRYNYAVGQCFSTFLLQRNPT